MSETPALASWVAKHLTGVPGLGRTRRQARRLARQIATGQLVIPPGMSIVEYLERQHDA